jgi:hypothetical protein
MRVTRFKKLRNAIANLNIHFITQRVSQLRDDLSGKGLEFDPLTTVVTEGGIYYIEPESGLATKVALYNAAQELFPGQTLPGKRTKSGYLDVDTLEKLNKYHLMRCNYVTQAERDKWKGEYRVAQRGDGAFYYRLFANYPDGGRNSSSSGGLFGSKSSDADMVDEIDDQKLEICHHCLMKVNSLLENVLEFTKEEFEASQFFDAGFDNSWRSRGAYSRERGSMADIYPEDWEKISATRKKQAQYICESCNFEMSDNRLRHFAHIHPTDHLRNKISYVRLRCLCVACMADQPNSTQAIPLEDYREFQERFLVS